MIFPQMTKETNKSRRGGQPPAPANISNAKGGSSMREQILATLFRGYAEELQSCRASIASIGPEADELIVALDDLVAFLLEQAQLLEDEAALFPQMTK